VDRYTLLAPLGEGGQAAVWQARDPLDGNVVALKIIAMRSASGSELERLRQEARLLAKLRHPSLCRCHGMFEDLRHEVVGFAMDHIAGRALDAVVTDSRFSKALRERTVLYVARALAHIHEAGAVHRDVKLSNVIVDERFFEAPDDPSLVKLVDFGVAALDGMRMRLTATGHAVGTPAYMAPEQMDPSHWGVESAGPAADLFAFGILCWRVFIGGHPTNLPADAGLGAYLMAYRNAAKDGGWPPRMAAKGAVRATRRCLVLQPQDRLGDAALLVARLEEAMGMSSRDSVEMTGAHALPRVAPITLATDVDERTATRIAETREQPTVLQPSTRRLGEKPLPTAGPASGDPSLPDIDTEPSAPPSGALESARRSGAQRHHGSAAPPAASAPRRERGAHWWLPAALAIGAGAFAVTWLTRGTLWDEVESDDGPNIPIASATASASSTRLIVDGIREDRVTPTVIADPQLCSTCFTGQSCGWDCNARIRGADEFVLRLLQVAHSPADGPADPVTTKGVQVVVCTDRCRDLSDGRDGLRVSGDELARGISITITQGGRTLIRWSRAALRDGVLRRDVCDGLSFRFDGREARKYRSAPVVEPFEGGLRWVAFYLDPPDAMPRCPGASQQLP
jgi:serine/threonine-protein kinase